MEPKVASAPVAQVPFGLAFLLAVFALVFFIAGWGAPALPFALLAGAIFALSKKVSKQPENEDLRRGTLIATLITPFAYALLLGVLFQHRFLWEQLFGKGELFLAAGIALTPAILQLGAKARAERRLGGMRNVVNVYGIALLLLWLSYFTLWMIFTLTSNLHVNWIAEWGGIVAIVTVFEILSPPRRSQKSALP